jgi:hypothetical protein
VGHARACPCRTGASSPVSRTGDAGASPATDAAVISGETMIVRAGRACGPFVGANERGVRFPPLRPRHRSKDGTRRCERCWQRFESSRWHGVSATYTARAGARPRVQIERGRVRLLGGVRTTVNSGCSSTWSERLLREQEAGGSNPLTPTTPAIPRVVSRRHLWCMSSPAVRCC